MTYEGFAADRPAMAESTGEFGERDELHRLMVHPVVLGTGKRLSTDGATPTDLELVDSRKVGPDVLLLTYRPASTATV